jgi:hypothetical protein
MIRIPRCLNNRHTDVSKFFSPTHRPDSKKINSVALVRDRNVPTKRPLFLAKLVPPFADREFRVVKATDPLCYVLGFESGVAAISSKSLLSWTHEAEWTSFQTHYFSENLLLQGTKPECTLLPRNITFILLLLIPVTD